MGVSKGGPEPPGKSQVAIGFLINSRTDIPPREGEREREREGGQLN